MKWISLKDRMPSPRKTVFLCFQQNGKHHIEKGEYIPGYGLQAFDLLMDPEEYQEWITHWMPIPKPPEIP